MNDDGPRHQSEVSMQAAIIAAGFILAIVLIGGCVSALSILLLSLAGLL